MDFNSIAFLGRLTPIAGGGGPTIRGVSRAGPSGFTNTITFTPPAAMQAGDQLVLVGHWDAGYTSANVGTFSDRSPANWLSAPSPRRLLISNSFGSVPGSITLTLSGSGLHEYSVFAVSGGVSTGAVVNSGVGTTGSSTSARNHAYTAGAANSLILGFIDWTGGGVTGAGSADADHLWDLKTGEGYNNGFGRVVTAAGSYNASLAPTGAISGSEYGWVEIGDA